MNEELFSCSTGSARQAAGSPAPQRLLEPAQPSVICLAPALGCSRQAVHAPDVADRPGKGVGHLAVALRHPGRRQLPGEVERLRPAH